jgi:hypothetical protein
LSDSIDIFINSILPEVRLKIPYANSVIITANYDLLLNTLKTEGVEAFNLKLMEFANKKVSAFSALVDGVLSFFFVPQSVRDPVVMYLVNFNIGETAISYCFRMLETGCFDLDKTTFMSYATYFLRHGKWFTYA